MKIFTLLLLSLSIINLASCKKDDDISIENTDYLIFGHFYKNCTGEECIQTYLMNNGKLYKDVKANQTRANRYNFIELENSKYLEVRNLFFYFPDELFNERRNIFGCPDCKGQGGLFIAYKKNGELREWRIDQDKKSVPTYLHLFIDKVNEKIKHINS